MNQQQQQVCHEHSGQCKAIAVLEQTDRDQWKAINGMRAWVIAGMGSLLLECIVVLGGIVFKKLGLM